MTNIDKNMKLQCVINGYVYLLSYFYYGLKYNYGICISGTYLLMCDTHREAVSIIKEIANNKDQSLKYIVQKYGFDKLKL
jgi:hypothetical protein